MASVELATGYYQLVPSMKGNKEAIVGEITGAVTRAPIKLVKKVALGYPLGWLKG